jgi:PDZ domain-containing protein
MARERPAERAPARQGRHLATAIVALVLFVAMVLVVLLVPVGFVARSPGQTVDLLGNTPAGDPVIVAEGPQTYPSEGGLLLATVSQTPVDRRLSLFQALVHHLLNTHEVLQRSDVYQAGATAEGVAASDAQAMQEAQTYAIVAALRMLQQELPEGEQRDLVTQYVVAGEVLAGGPSDGKLQAGDILVLVDDQPVTTVAEVVQEVRRDNDVGTILPVTVRREGQGEMILMVELGRSDLNVPTMGVTWVQQYDYDEYLAGASFGLDPAIGGGAAGLPLALALYDRLTPGDLTGGLTVAAAGVIQLDNPSSAPASGPFQVATIASVEGLRQRIVAAEDAGADVFLLPRANCADLAGFTSTVELVPVSSFYEAVEAMERIAVEGEAAAVAHC